MKLYQGKLELAEDSELGRWTLTLVLFAGVGFMEFLFTLTW